MWVVANAVSKRLESARLTPNAKKAIERMQRAEPSSIRVCKAFRLQDADRSLGEVDGVANRVDRLKAIGNGQVPAVVKLAWEVLSA
jgi:DNA (cytosine-5)-methyltransferase 1